MLTVETLASGGFAPARNAPFPNIEGGALVVSDLSQLGVLSWAGCCLGCDWRSIGDGGLQPNSVAVVVVNLIDEILVTQFIHKGVSIIDDSKVERVVGIGCVTGLVAKG